jgi:hypothetical protein
MAGVILILGVVVMLALRLFRDDIPPAGYRWARLTVALVMLVALVAGVVADYRDRRRHRPADGGAPR